MFDFLEDNLLIITPNSYKLAILKYLNDNKLIMNIKFMTKTEYKKSIKFDYGIEAIHYLKNKEIEYFKCKNMKVENAITILDNLYYIEDKKYNNKKLDTLVEIKNDLDKNNLLIYDNLFKKILKRRDIVVYGYGMLNKFDKKMFSNATIIPYKNNKKDYSIYHFEYIKDEVEFVFQKICELVKNGIDINKISLMNIDSEYYPYIKMMEKFYDIKVDLNNSDSIMGTIIGKRFFDLVNSEKDANKILLSLKEYEDNSEYSFLINLLNKYSNYNLSDYLDEIKYELESHIIKKEIYENVVKVKDVFDHCYDNEYVFLMNFNSSSIPSINMDTDYITDDICSLVGAPSKEEENELIKDNTINYLSSINNIFISYKDKSPFNEYNKSFLLDEMKPSIIEYERKFDYSHLANKSIYGMYLDDYFKYGIQNKNLDILYSSYGMNDYGDYDNQTKDIDSNKLLEYLNNRIKLSYSSMNNFYECEFKYYLNNILRVNIFENNFNTIVGSLFHHVLCKMNEDASTFDFDKEYNEFIENKDGKYYEGYEFTDRELFFLDKLKKDLEYIVTVIKDQQFNSGLTNYLAEKEISVDLDKNPNIIFTGKVDKIMYKEKNGETFVSIVDYKTGNSDKASIDYIDNGLYMQLPSYLYLVSHYDDFKNIKFTGFYLQHILNLDVMKDNKKTIDELKRDSLKLDGFSTSDKSRLGMFDPDFEKSTMIKSMSLTKDGNFGAYSKIVSDQEIENIIEKTHQKIMEVAKEIKNGRFIVNPKYLKGENISCKYCDFKDICYHREKDIVYLDDSKDEDEEM